MSSIAPGNAGGAAEAEHRLELHSEQVRLLYTNASIGAAVNTITATVLVYLLLTTVPERRMLAWWVFMMLLSLARYVLGRAYWGASPERRKQSKWGSLFTLGACLSGVGWGAAGVFLFPAAHPTNQVIMTFVVGGMMLGGATILAPRPEAFLAFLIPTGICPGIRFILTGDEPHVAMGLLAILFTIATLLTTYRIHQTIDSSLRLQFVNRDLVQELRAANAQTEALNQQLELRVQERTARLQQSTDQLQAEIAQREQMEEELLRARKLESLGVLAGGIAHDFNNFLTVILGNLEMAKMRLDAEDMVHEILSQASSACRRAALLASQLLTFAGGGAPVRRVVSLGDHILDAVRLARAGTPISISVDIPEDLWPAEVDPGQIGQVLHNVLINARQATPEGGMIEVSARNVTLTTPPAAGEYVRIAIQDFGCGIAPDVLPRVFDPYFSTKGEGSGLGLATAYAIVTKHGGHIDVQSKLGEGSTFRIDLPASSHVPEAEAREDNILRRGTGKLLIMDDEEGLRNLLTRVLTKLGYEPKAACDGAEAIALYESALESGQRFAAVLLDLTVSGGMGGIEAASKLREIDPHVKLIVSSGYSAAPVMAEYRKYGFDDVLPKPWTPAQVSEVFVRTLAGQRQRRSD